MKKFIILVFSITASVLLYSQSAEKIDNLGFSNLYKIDEGVYRSEQPKKEQFKALEEYGVKEILSLRFWNSDKKPMKGTNLLMLRVRMNAHDINNYDVVEALKTIKNRKGPIVIHCKHGSDRTGAIIAMYRIIFQDWSKEDAINELKNGGFGFHNIYINIPRYITNADIDHIKSRL